MPSQTHAGMIVPQQSAQAVMMARQPTGQERTAEAPKEEKEHKKREDPHGLLDADVKLSVDNMKLLLVQELPEHGYTGSYIKDSLEEEIRGRLRGRAWRL